MPNIKKTKYLGSKKINFTESPDEFYSRWCPNPHKDKNYVIRFSSPELTSICPITSQPDFGNIIIDYIPSKLIIESKSLKLFLFSFRNYGGFHEDCTLKISKKLKNLLNRNGLESAVFGIQEAVCLLTYFINQEKTF